jgi:8-oxo-dGDP phosphatase
MSPSFRPVGERRVHEGRIWRVAVATFEAPDGSTFERDVVRSPGAVGVVPLEFDCEGNAVVVLVRQYRPVLDREMVEIPAGMRDVDGEPPEETARRELAEEAGLAADTLEPLVTFHNSAGMTDAETQVFLATDLREVPHDRQGPEEAHLEVLRLGLRDALDQVGSGAITDAKTVVGLLALDRRLRVLDGAPVGPAEPPPGPEGTGPVS